MIKHFNIKVVGRVQKVGFRFSCVETANLYGVNGFVRNELDKSVYIEAEGDERNLAEFISWCRKGPRWAKVIDVQINEAPNKGYRSFEIVK